MIGADPKDALAQLTDSYNRKMDYLRISVTDRCNFRCQYCMPEDIKFQDKSHILTLEEMLTFAEACLLEKFVLSVLHHDSAIA